MNKYVVRQPIKDKEGNLFGYEILFQEEKGSGLYGIDCHIRPLRGRKEQGGLLFGGYGVLRGGQHALPAAAQICGALHGRAGAV